MKTFAQMLCLVWMLALPACGSSTESDTAATPSATNDVPVNPLPMSERN